MKPLRVLVRVEHFRAAKFCAAGARDWGASHGLSWDHFVSDGYPSDILEATNDALALKVVAKAREMNAEVLGDA